MIGAIIGDMLGSNKNVYKKYPKNFKAFDINNYMTDDSYLTLSVMRMLMNHYPLKYDIESIEAMQDELKASFSMYVRKHPGVGWGEMFYRWAKTPNKLKKPYNSFGNGGAMRVSPVGWAAKTKEEVKALSKIVTEITHNYPEGLKGAEAIAMCVFLAKNGASKDEIKDEVVKNYYPHLNELDYDDLVANYIFDVTAAGSVPHAIYCFLISRDFEDAVRTAISIGGDMDTIASMTGAIAEAFYNHQTYKVFIQNFMYLFFSKEVEDKIKNFYDLIKSTRLNK